MTNKIVRSIGVILVILVVSGCASNGSKPVVARPVVKKIALLPVAAPLAYTVENRNPVVIVVPISTLAIRAENREKSRLLTQKMLELKTTIGGDLTKVLAEALREQGYEVIVLNDVSRKADDPDRIDYRAIKTDADAILHVYFREVGMYASMFSSDYLPRVNASAKLYAPSIDGGLYGENFHYGVDARAGKTWAVLADPKIAFPTFEALLGNPRELDGVFNFGAQALGRRMAEDIKRTSVTGKY